VTSEKQKRMGPKGNFKRVRETGGEKENRSHPPDPKKICKTKLRVTFQKKSGGGRLERRPSLKDASGTGEVEKTKPQAKKGRVFRKKGNTAEWRGAGIIDQGKAHKQAGEQEEASA